MCVWRGEGGFAPCPPHNNVYFMFCNQLFCNLLKFVDILGPYLSWTPKPLQLLPWPRPALAVHEPTQRCPATKRGWDSQNARVWHFDKQTHWPNSIIVVHEPFEAHIIPSTGKLIYLEDSSGARQGNPSTSLVSLQQQSHWLYPSRAWWVGKPESVRLVCELADGANTHLVLVELRHLRGVVLCSSLTGSPWQSQQRSVRIHACMC